MFNLFALFTSFSLITANQQPLPLALPVPVRYQAKPLASHEMSLEKRYDIASVNEVFKDNILLNLAYLEGKPINPRSVDWNSVKQPFTYQFSLKPGQTFAYHNDVKSGYSNVVKTTNAHFNAQEGFKSDGYLYGDGVCHLASLIYWTAKDAGLQAEAPTNHDFMKINQIPRQFGVSIYNVPGQTATNTNQNLYVTNTTQNTVNFVFNYDGHNLTTTIDQVNS